MTPIYTKELLVDRNVPRPALAGCAGSRGTIFNDITLPGSPFDILRAVSSVERPRRACPVLTGCLPAGRQGRGASTDFCLICGMNLGLL
jgi:hypothetical protein